jgi:hypothetical protein
MPNAIWIAPVQPLLGDASVSAPVELSSTGACPVASWTGTGFVVAWTDGTGLKMQRLDPKGKALGPPILLLSKPSQNTCTSSLVDTGSGLAIAWSEGDSLQRENVGLIDSGGALGTPILLGTVEGLAGPAGVALAEVQGHTYAAFPQSTDAGTPAAVVSEIDWSHATATQQSVTPGYLEQFIAAGDQLWLSTERDDNGTWSLYQGSPGAVMRVATQSCVGSPYEVWGLAADACARLVELGAQPYTPGGVADGFFAQSLGASTSPVALGRATQGAIAGAQSTFGVLWYSRIGPPGGPPDDAPHGGTLSLDVLSWQ